MTTYVITGTVPTPRNEGVPVFLHDASTDPYPGLAGKTNGEAGRQISTETTSKMIANVIESVYKDVFVDVTVTEK